MVQRPRKPLWESSRFLLGTQARPQEVCILHSFINTSKKEWTRDGAGQCKYSELHLDKTPSPLPDSFAFCELITHSSKIESEAAVLNAMHSAYQD